MVTEKCARRNWIASFSSSHSNKIRPTINHHISQLLVVVGGVNATTNNRRSHVVGD